MCAVASPPRHGQGRQGACFCHFDDRIGFSPTNNRIKGNGRACTHYQMRWMVISVEERKKKQHGETQSGTYLCPLNRTVSANKPYICLTVTLRSVFLMAQCSCVGDDQETKKTRKRKKHLRVKFLQPYSHISFLTFSKKEPELEGHFIIWL